MDAKLVVVGSEAKPKEIKLRLPVIIGRGRQATLVLPHPLVSRKHCEIVECEGFLVVRDLGSLNGTFVNQRRIQQAVLPPGGLLTLGAVTFRAVYEASGTDSPAVDAFPSASQQAGGKQDSDSLPDTDDLSDLARREQHIEDLAAFLRDLQ